MRARHPTRGVLRPGVFLPGASEDDMLALTERVIITALKDWETCAANGMSVKLAVNVPVSALVKLPIPTILREERPRAENWPGLIMEVTEDEIIHDLKIANEVADALRAYNCTLALDDFGAGYSSLARLRQLPFSELKIDRSYVTNCHATGSTPACARPSSSWASASGSRPSPRASKTTHESHKLQGIGCNVGQGYLFAKPMAKSESHRDHAPPPDAGSRRCAAAAGGASRRLTKPEKPRRQLGFRPGISPLAHVTCP